ncbi:MAG TPA: hypothetical protein VE398_10435 [Acidobacteriota bacterium]|nr:hypothetical protein [Acidobacteriota bacterium]
MNNRLHAEQGESVLEAIDIGPIDILFLRLLLEPKSESEEETVEESEQPESHNTQYL